MKAVFIIAGVTTEALAVCLLALPGPAGPSAPVSPQGECCHCVPHNGNPPFWACPCDALDGADGCLISAGHCDLVGFCFT